MKYVLHPDALDEYRDAARHYAEVSPELGDAFIEAIEGGIRQAAEHPRRWKRVEEDVRRYLVHRFPYGIYYTIESEYILIVAVMHMSRRPGYWRGRVAGQ